MTRLAAILLLLCASASATTPTAMLVWDYVVPKPNIVFEVWRSVDLNKWELYDLTTATNFSASTAGAAGFFKVIARDIDMGRASGCAASFALLCLSNSATRPTGMLVWDYVEPEPKIVFEVWRSVDLRKWELYDLTTATCFPISGLAGFFKVTARDTNTGRACDCAVRIQFPPRAVHSVTLAWDASRDRTATGYTVYYGTATGTYGNKISVGNVTRTTVSNLVAGVTYYFVVKAFSSAGLEAAPTNEVFWSPLP